MKTITLLILFLFSVSCDKALSSPEKEEKVIFSLLSGGGYRVCKRCVFHDTYANFYECRDKYDYKYVTNFGIIEGKCEDI